MSILERLLAKLNTKKTVVKLHEHKYEAFLPLDVWLKGDRYTNFMPIVCSTCYSVSGIPSANFNLAKDYHAEPNENWEQFILKLQKYVKEKGRGPPTLFDNALKTFYVEPVEETL